MIIREENLETAERLGALPEKAIEPLALHIKILVARIKGGK